MSSKVFKIGIFVDIITNLRELFDRKTSILITLNIEILSRLQQMDQIDLLQDYAITLDSGYAKKILDSDKQIYPGSQICVDILQAHPFSKILIIGGNDEHGQLLSAMKKKAVILQVDLKSLDLNKLKTQTLKSIEDPTTRNVALLPLPFFKALKISEFLQKALPNTTFIPVGGGLNIALGIERRAPQQFRRMGLESLWRTYQNPKRVRRHLKTVMNYIRLKRLKPIPPKQLDSRREGRVD
jgi:hypothetical protein